MYLRQYIQKKIIEEQLTPAALGKHYGLSSTAVRNIVHGDYDIPTENMLNKIAKADDMPVDQLRNTLTYLPILGAKHTVNLAILDIIKKYNGLNEDDLVTILNIIQSHYSALGYESSLTKTYLERIVINGFQLGDHGDYNSYPPLLLRKGKETCAVESFRHLYVGNVMFSTEDNLWACLHRAIITPGISSYRIVMNNEEEIDYFMKWFASHIVVFHFNIYTVLLKKDKKTNEYTCEEKLIYDSKTFL